MRLWLVIALLASLVATAQAWPTPAPPPEPAPPPVPEPSPAPAPEPQACAPCERGEALIRERAADLDAEWREAARELLLAFERESDFPPAMRATVVELLRGRSDDERSAIAHALCGDQGDKACVERVLVGLTCASGGQCPRPLADDQPEARPHDPDYPAVGVGDPDCEDRIVPRPRLGVGIDIGSGWQRSVHPTAGRAWSVGASMRLRLLRRFALVVRGDRTNGKDAGLDDDGDRRDDVATGDVTRYFALGGLSVMLLHDRARDGERFIEVELLGGYMHTTSPGAEAGPMAGIDVAHQIDRVRIGVRALRGLDDNRDAAAILVHMGFTRGGAKPFYKGLCFGQYGLADSKSSWALGVELPISGMSLGTGLGYMPPGFGLRVARHLSRRLHLVAQADLTAFTNGDGDRVVHQSLLGGIRIDATRTADEGATRRGTIIGIMAGYAHAAVTEPSHADSGPIVDVSLGLMQAQPRNAAALSLHGRFGVTSANEDLRVLYLAISTEHRLVGSAWFDD